MHHLLTTPEIVIEIFGFADYKDLAECPSVCKSWFLPAIAVRWQTADWADLVGILMKEESDPPDWDRLYIYSSQVKHLMSGKYPHTSCGRYSKVESDVFNPQHTAGGPLFPRVRRAQYDIGSNASFRLGNSLLRQFPRLSVFHTLIWLYNACDRQIADEFWSCLSYSKSTLTELRIKFYPFNEDQHSFWASQAPTLSLLTMLEIFESWDTGDESSPEVLQALARLPNLKTLKTDIRGGGSTAHPSHPLMNAEHFLQLRYLHSTRQLGKAVFQGSWFPPPELQTFSCCLDAEDTLHCVIEKLVEHNSQIRSLMLWCEGPVRLDGRVSSLQSLRCLTITASTGWLMISDYNITQIATSLSQLQVLILSSLGPDDPPCIGTLSTLAHLARHCPHITRIVMRIDATRIPPPVPVASLSSNTPDTGHKPPRQPQTLELDLTGSPLRSSGGVAEWLLGCFSQYRMIEISVLDDKNQELRERYPSNRDWIKVSEYLCESLCNR